MTEVKSTKFQSPVPILVKIRNLIWGKTPPDIFTRVTYYMITVIWTTFFLWSMISYFTLTSRELILSKKGIPVEEIIEQRGEALGFQEGEFLNRLLTFHSISIICWGVVFFGLILLYRKKSRFVYFILGGTLFYIGTCIFYIGFTYFIEDTTLYDKVALLIIIVASLLHSYLMKNERSGGSISFFGEAKEPRESRKVTERKNEIEEVGEEDNEFTESTSVEEDE